MLKKNLIANYLGQGWAAIMGLAFIPHYIRHLGIEAYGLIGIYAVLQAWLNLLDMGMTQTLNREIARLKVGNHAVASFRDLLRSVEIISSVMVVIIIIVFAFSSDWVARNWIHNNTLNAEIISQAFNVMGLVVSLRLIEGIYRNCIIGLQRQVLFNLVNGVLSTLRWGGAVLVLLFISPTVNAFFLWQAIISLVTLISFATLTYKYLPSTNKSAQFSKIELFKVWNFSCGMIVITFLSLLLMQVDKVLLSKFLSLEEYGYYILASTLAGGLYTLIKPIAQALYPKICDMHSRDDSLGLADLYHTSSQLVVVIAGGPAIVVIIFAHSVLWIWTGDNEIASKTAPLLSILVLGNLLNGLWWIPYQTQLAFGWTRLTVIGNLIAVILFLPLIIWGVFSKGAEGAAWGWVAVNLGYILISAQFMFKRILSEEKINWYMKDLIKPLGTGLIVALIMRYTLFSDFSDKTNQLIFILVVTSATSLSMLLVSQKLLVKFRKYVNSILLNAK